MLAIFLHHLELCAPLFLMVLVGWTVMKLHLFHVAVSKGISQFVFRFLMPVLLFKILSTLSEMPPVDWRVLAAFFGSCLVVFCLGKYSGRFCFRQDSTGQVISGMGGIFGNNVQLGIPIVQVSLGSQAIPTISLIIIFNVLLLWTAGTACVEFGKTNRLDVRSFGKAVINVVKNPIVMGIIAGSLWGITGWKLPSVVVGTVNDIATATTPMALLAVGMGLAQHSFDKAFPKAMLVTVLKLVIQPFFVFFFCRWIGLADMQTYAATVLACLPCAINLYIMASEFEAEEGEASNAIFLSTLLSAFTVPLVLTLLGVGVV